MPTDDFTDLAEQFVAFFEMLLLALARQNGAVRFAASPVRRWIERSQEEMRQIAEQARAKRDAAPLPETLPEQERSPQGRASQAWTTGQPPDQPGPPALDRIARTGLPRPRPKPPPPLRQTRQAPASRAGPLPKGPLPRKFSSPRRRPLRSS